MLTTFQKALRGAKQRTGDDTLSTNVKAGEVQVCRVVYDKPGGGSTVTPVTGYLPPEKALAYLNVMGHRYGL